jgi:DNA ligase-1
VKALPVEINVFDVMFYEGKSFIDKPFLERRKLVEKIVKEKELVIRPAVQIVTDSEKEAMKFYEDALKIGEEGIMIKRIDAPYRQGRRVGYMAKMKPLQNDLDLVIVGAEYGTGKRGGWLTSYIIAKVGSVLKEKEEEGTTYDEMTKILKPLIIEDKGDYVKIKPKVVVSVNYQNIQESPSYSSGFALRFPRITHYRPDRRIDDIASLLDIKSAAKKGKR